jgi:hypothetical protein
VKIRGYIIGNFFQFTYNRRKNLAKKAKLSGEEQVAQFLAETTHPMRAEIMALREIILGSGQRLTEHIKWNAPSFCHEGEDRFTFKLNSPTAVDIVFHRGAKVEALPEERLVEDPEGLIKWATTDRGVASFGNMAEIEQRKTAVVELVNSWVLASAEDLHE